MDLLLSPILQVVTPSVTTDAGQSVHLEVKELDGDAVLHFTNFTGVTGYLTVVLTDFSVAVAIPTGQQVRSVEVTSPDNPTLEREAVRYSVEDGKVSFRDRRAVLDSNRKLGLALPKSGSPRPGRGRQPAGSGPGQLRQVINRGGGAR